MTLSRQAQEAIESVTKLHSMISTELHHLSEHLAEHTHGVFTVCEGRFDSTIQLYHNRGVAPVNKAIEMLKSMVDDEALNVDWEDDEQICYNFKIDKQSFCVVFDKGV